MSNLQQSHALPELTALDRAYCEYWAYFFVLMVQPSAEEWVAFKALEQRMEAIAFSNGWELVET